MNRLVVRGRLEGLKIFGKGIRAQVRTQYYPDRYWMFVGALPSSHPDPSDHTSEEASFPAAMRAAGGFTLGLQLLLATSAATSMHATTNSDDISEVGISDVHAICDPLRGGCISSDEEVQDEIIAGLEANDEVTGTYMLVLACSCVL